MVTSSSYSARGTKSKWAAGAPAGPRGVRGLPLLAHPPGVLVYLLLTASLGMNWLWISGRLKLTGRPLKTAGQLLTEGSPCGSVNVDALHAHLSDVVLVINIRQEAGANKAVVSMLRGIYGRIFDTVMFLGPKEDASLGVEVRSSMPWATNGSYSYFFFPKLVAKFPKAAGFLWMDGDVQLNYWHLMSANKSKLWLPLSPSCCHCACDKVISFLPPPEGPDESSNAPACVDSPSVRAQAQVALERLEPGHQVEYNRSVGTASYGYPRLRVNAFYVPNRLSMPFAFELCPMFRDLGVVQEVAVPMMFKCLETPETYDKVLNSLICLEGQEEGSPQEQWLSSTAGLYPWAVASAESRVQLVDTLRQFDYCVQKPVALQTKHS